MLKNKASTDIRKIKIIPCMTSVITFATKYCRYVCTSSGRGL